MADVERAPSRIGFMRTSIRRHGNALHLEDIEYDDDAFDDTEDTEEDEDWEGDVRGLVYSSVLRRSVDGGLCSEDDDDEEDDEVNPDPPPLLKPSLPSQSISLAHVPVRLMSHPNSSFSSDGWSAVDPDDSDCDCEYDDGPTIPDHGLSRSALSHIKGFWSARRAAWTHGQPPLQRSSGLSLFTRFSPPAARENPGDDTASTSSGNSNILNMNTPIYPRMGDIPHLRDARFATMDRAFGGLPPYSIAKMMFLHDMLARSVAVTPCESRSLSPALSSDVELGEGDCEGDVPGEVDGDGHDDARHDAKLVYLQDDEDVDMDTETDIADAFVDISLSSSGSLRTSDSHDVGSGPRERSGGGEGKARPELACVVPDSIDTSPSPSQDHAPGQPHAQSSADSPSPPLTPRSPAPEPREWEVDWSARWGALLHQFHILTSPPSLVLFPLSLSSSSPSPTSDFGSPTSPASPLSPLTPTSLALPLPLPITLPSIDEPALLGALHSFAMNPYVASTRSPYGARFGCVGWKREKERARFFIPGESSEDDDDVEDVDVDDYFGVAEPVSAYDGATMDEEEDYGRLLRRPIIRYGGETEWFPVYDAGFEMVHY